MQEAEENLKKQQKVPSDFENHVSICCFDKIYVNIKIEYIFGTITDLGLKSDSHA